MSRAKPYKQHLEMHKPKVVKGRGKHRGGRTKIAKYGKTRGRKR
jgi:hypothetical protein